MNASFGPAVREQFPLDPAIAYLNHGTVGVAPWPVLRHAAALREAIERNPARFLRLELPQRLATARQQVAAFLGAAASDLAFVANATAGCNAVLRSLELCPGDEIVLTDHGYGCVLPRRPITNSPTTSACCRRSPPANEASRTGLPCTPRRRGRL